MKKWLAGLACLTIGMLLLAGDAWAALVIETPKTAEQLVQNILGSGVTFSNPGYHGSTVASGFFSGGTDIGGPPAKHGLGIDTGIILTSGLATNAPGPNNQDNKTGSNGTPGDTDLNGLLPSGADECDDSSPTCDAAILEFDFAITAEKKDLSFQYVFASDEYNEFTNSEFNDVFGFFLDGKNIALIPGTSDPVAINTVNGGGPTFGHNPSHPEFFNNNDLQDGGPFFNIQYDGFTNVFTASATNLGSATHHIKLAIADTGDDAYDSAVFIQGGSFVGGPPPGGEGPPPSVPEPATLTLMGAGMIGLAAVGRRQRA